MLWDIVFISTGRIPWNYKAAAITILTRGGGHRGQLVLGVMGMLMWLSGMRDWGGLGQDSGSVQSLQDRQAGSWRAGGWNGSLCRPNPSNGWVSFQDESSQGLSQVTFSSSIFHICNNCFTLDCSTGVLMLYIFYNKSRMYQWPAVLSIHPINMARCQYQFKLLKLTK